MLSCLSCLSWPITNLRSPSLAYCFQAIVGHRGTGAFCAALHTQVDLEGGDLSVIALSHGFLSVIERGKGYEGSKRSDAGKKRRGKGWECCSWPRRYCWQDSARSRLMEEKGEAFWFGEE